MAVKTNHMALLQKLKKQVRVLQHKEALAKNRLRKALKKIHKLGKSYKSRLASSVRAMKGRIADAQASTYARAAVDFERQLAKGIVSKGRAVKSALASIEKKHAAKLMKSLAKKGKKAGKAASSSRKAG